MDGIVDRRSGLGGTDVAAIMGLSPFKGPFDVYALKCGLVDIDAAANNPRAQWGKILERLIADRYAQETGRAVEWCDQTKQHPVRSWQIWTPDAFVRAERGGPIIRGLDAKTSGLDQRIHWGEAGTDEVPDHYAIQCQWYMSAGDLPAWDIALLLAGSDFRIYTIEADKDIQAVLLEEAEKFWTNHVLAKNPPDIGASELAKEYLRQRFPRNVSTMRPADQDEADLIEAYRLIREEFQEKEDLHETMKNRIKERIGDADGITFQGGRVTWKKTRDSIATDWEGIARKLLLESPRERQTAILDAFTAPKPGIRRFDFRLKG